MIEALATAVSIVRKVVFKPKLPRARIVKIGPLWTKQPVPPEKKYIGPLNVDSLEHTVGIVYNLSGEELKRAMYNLKIRLMHQQCRGGDCMYGKPNKPCPTFMPGPGMKCSR